MIHFTMSKNKITNINNMNLHWWCPSIATNTHETKKEISTVIPVFCARSRGRLAQELYPLIGNFHGNLIFVIFYGTTLIVKIEITKYQNWVMTYRRRIIAKIIIVNLFPGVIFNRNSEIITSLYGNVIKMTFIK